MLTARPLNAGKDFVSFGNTTSGWGSGQSLDQYLATRLAPPTKFKSLQLGVHVRDTEVRARISYTASNQPVPPREDPKDVFTTLFGGATATDSRRHDRSGARAALGATEERVRLDERRDSALMGLVGAEDRTKLDAHLTAMRDVEQRLVGTPGRNRHRRGHGQPCARRPRWRPPISESTISTCRPARIRWTWPPPRSPATRPGS